MAEPITKFDPAGKASILSYNVPEPASYEGENVIVLELADDDSGYHEWFVDDAFKIPQRESFASFADAAPTVEAVAQALRTGNLKWFPGIGEPAATNEGLFSTQSAVAAGADKLDTATTSTLAQGFQAGVVRPDLAALVYPSSSGAGAVGGVAAGVGGAAGVAVREEAAAELLPVDSHLPDAVRGAVMAGVALGNQAVKPAIAYVDVRHVQEMLLQKKRLNVYRTLYGKYAHSFHEDPVPSKGPQGEAEARPRIMLVEKFRLSSYLGQYGAGRTVKTFSLLPGEKTTISIKTFTKTQTEYKSASSILDSVTQESADDFENSVMNENSDRQAKQDSLDWHVEAEAKASWGWGSAKVSGGVKGSTASQREQFAKNVSNATNKHAAKASAKRDVQVNTSSEVKSESGEETSIVRQLENINVGRVLNFVFRQMNQEHISILHLIDVRVAFWNGWKETTHEVPLSDLDKLLKAYVKADKIPAMRKIIVDQLSTLFDYQDKLVQPPMLEERAIGANDRYLRWRRTTSVYKDETGNEIAVPGVIMNVDKIVMRTEGIIVDAILGQGNALDDYSAALQANAVRQRTLSNDREALGQKLVNDKETFKADIFKVIFPASVGLPGKISVSASDSGTTISTTPTAGPSGPSGP